ncbi:MAG TPA: bifunctional adenosylcobinamide kinase/adenosylcobinamide-phosphate guanylyltransferase [Gaiellaceae bacterium]|jgi:adenosyl cobinamide kinase/adenosyl cobinamide phosphate guanylyltransferase|nr:bifunctional adenosylcobinamide kinase/adenosylcobinamide-phosphate guanylyltransferase [Gaiellaceae bacterium]
MLVVLLGGARSGKSRLAVELAGDRAAFVATGTASDEEMADRIARHRAERPAGWRTLEEPRDLSRALAALEPGETAVVDCLSLWVSNLLETTPEEEIVALAERDAAAFAARDGLTVVVSNEVGLGLVPMHPVGRAFRDALGRVNAVWSAAADEAYLVVAGRRLRLDE